MKFSCTLALLGATTVIAAPSTLRRQSGTTNVVENGSFEDGAIGWTLDGGAQVLSNDESNHWNFKAPEGTHFGYVLSRLRAPILSHSLSPLRSNLCVNSSH
jgi:hypothetical protein